MSVLIDLDTLRDGLHDHSVCETSTGEPVPVATIRRLCCDADIIPVVLDGDGVALDVGRAKRVATREQRRALRAMYRTCAHPGCSVGFDDCDIHHVNPWTPTGLTDLDNLLPLCSRHHHLVHEGGWTLTLRADRTTVLVPPRRHHPLRRLHRRRRPRRRRPVRDPRAPATGGRTAPQPGTRRRAAPRTAQPAQPDTRRDRRTRRTHPSTSPSTRTSTPSARRLTGARAHSRTWRWLALQIWAFGRARDHDARAGPWVRRCLGGRDCHRVVTEPSAHDPHCSTSPARRLGAATVARARYEPGVTTMDGRVILHRPPTRRLLAWLEVVVERPVTDLRARRNTCQVCEPEVDARPDPGIDCILIELSRELVVACNAGHGDVHVDAVAPESERSAQGAGGCAHDRVETAGVVGVRRIWNQWEPAGIRWPCPDSRRCRPAGSR